MDQQIDSCGKPKELHSGFHNIGKTCSAYGRYVPRAWLGSALYTLITWSGYFGWKADRNA
jgi:hypothetical protein